MSDRQRLPPLDLESPLLDDFGVTYLQRLGAKQAEYQARGRGDLSAGVGAAVRIYWEQLHDFNDTVPTGAHPP